jgi:DHA2 family multidrug resistance protein
MLVYRTIQGVGGGSLIPVSLAILRETFPPAQQGLAMAIYGMGWCWRRPSALSWEAG